jgi:hypothetical protein
MFWFFDRIMIEPYFTRRFSLTIGVMNIQDLKLFMFLNLFFVGVELNIYYKRQKFVGPKDLL